MKGDITDKITVDTVDLRGIPELAKGLPLKEQIIGLLKHGKMEAGGIAEELETKENTIRAILSKHKTIFVKIDKEWGLLSPEN